LSTRESFREIANRFALRNRSNIFMSKNGVKIN
jgi:hypothetical protein